MSRYLPYCIYHERSLTEHAREGLVRCLEEGFCCLHCPSYLAEGPEAVPDKALEGPMEEKRPELRRL